MHRLPALVAAVTGDDGAVHGVQRTWPDPRMPAKAGVAAPRKALGRIHGPAVRFGTVPADGLASLVVGEGIETVLSLITDVPEESRAAFILNRRALLRPCPSGMNTNGTFSYSRPLHLGVISSRRAALAGMDAGVVPLHLGVISSGKHFRHSRLRGVVPLHLGVISSLTTANHAET